MLSSAQIRGLTLEDFSILYSQCVVNHEVEKIIGHVLEEQYVKNNKILLYDVSDVPDLRHILVVKKLREKLSGCSVYIQNKTIYVDWSL
jgi:replicative superfamily II helicase